MALSQFFLFKRDKYVYVMTFFKNEPELVIVTSYFIEQ